MDCRESRDLLQDELDGRLSASDAARLAEHVATCAACAEEKRGLASLRATFRATPRPAAPAGFKDGVMSALPKGRVRNLPRVLGWIVAAAAVVVVGVTLIPQSWRGASVEREVAATSPAARRERVEAKRHAAPDVDEARIPDAAKSPADEDSEADAKPAAARKPAAPPAPARPSAEAMAAKQADDVAAPATRYVVFRDAAAAEEFAKELAAGDGWKSKDKIAGPGFVGGGAGVARGGADAGDARKRDALALLAKEASAANRRIVARTSVAAADVDAALAEEATRAGGSLVPRADTSKFAAVVEPPAPAAAATAAPQSADDVRKAAEKSKESGTFSAPAKKSAPPRVVVVIVVLETPR